MYIERDIEAKFNKLKEVYQSIAVVGPRQAGKTTFLKEHSKSMNSDYLLFDDPNIKELFEKDIKSFEARYLKGKSVSVFDEVQNAKLPGQKLKYLVDSGNKIWMTSSSEILLSKEVLSYLVGRVTIIRLFPLSLNEFLKSKIDLLNEETKKMAVLEHIIYGGYPKTVVSEDIEIKKSILKDLYETMILKDIAKNFLIEDINSLEALSKYLAINTSTILSYDKLQADLNLSFQTIKKYLDAMEKSYMVKRIPPFFKNRTKEITKRPKIYFMDTGIRNAIINEFKGELDGRLFENYVLTELVKLGFTPKYWRTKSKAEVDFIIEKDNKIIPIEVKVTSKGDSIEKSLASFIDEYKPKKAFIVMLNGKESKKMIKGCEINFVNILNLSAKLQ